jgi:hypothetical protein
VKGLKRSTAILSAEQEGQEGGAGGNLTVPHGSAEIRIYGMVALAARETSGFERHG